MSIWKPVDKDQIPESLQGKRNEFWGRVIEDFIESGEEAAVITGAKSTGSSLRSCVYNAIKRTGHLGDVEVMLRGRNVYMVRRAKDE